MMTNAAKKQHSEEEVFEAQLPRPAGYHILIALPEIEETYGDSGIIKTDTAKHHEYIMSIIGLVVDMGDMAYSDKERYPTGPWCKPGDFVMFRANSGTRFKVGEKEFRLMNDDSVEAVVPDPRGIVKA